MSSKLLFHVCLDVELFSCWHLSLLVDVCSYVRSSHVALRETHTLCTALGANLSSDAILFPAPSWIFSRVEVTRKRVSFHRACESSTGQIKSCVDVGNDLNSLFPRQWLEKGPPAPFDSLRTRRRFHQHLLEEGIYQSRSTTNNLTSAGIDEV